MSTYRCENCSIGNEKEFAHDEPKIKSWQDPRSLNFLLTFIGQASETLVQICFRGFFLCKDVKKLCKLK